MSMLATAGGAAIRRIGATRYENPVVTKELRTRMRGGRAYAIMAGYVVLLGIVLLLAYYERWSQYMGSYDPRAWNNARLGLHLFSDLTWVQAILIALIAPTLTSGAITHEREQQTLEMLSLTSLSPRNIVAGKVTSAMLYILMLLASSLPLAGICLMLGSISPLEILLVYLLLAAWAFLFCSIGVFYSSLLRRTATATLAAFATVVLYTIFTTSAAAALTYQPYAPTATFDFVYAGMSACVAADHALRLAPVLGVRIPVAAVGIAMMASIALLLLTVATTRQPYHKAEKPALIRLWLLGITVVGLFLLYGNLLATPYGPAGSNLEDFLVFMFSVLLFVVVVHIPVFATGPHRGRSVVRDVFLGPIREKIFANRLAGGLWFLALWFVLGSGAIILVLVLFMSGSTAASIGSFKAPDLLVLVQGAAALLASIVGMAAIGILASCALPTRQWAAGITLLFIILAWIVYPIMAAQHESAYHYGLSQAAVWQGVGGVQWHLAYLCPVATITWVIGDWHQGQNAPDLMQPERLLWLASVIAWAALAFVSLLLADWVSRRGKGIRDR